MVVERAVYACRKRQNTRTVARTRRQRRKFFPGKLCSDCHTNILVSDRPADGECGADATARTVKLNAERMDRLVRFIRGFVQLRNQGGHFVRRRRINLAVYRHALDEARAGQRAGIHKPAVTLADCARADPANNSGRVAAKKSQRRLRRVVRIVGFPLAFMYVPTVRAWSGCPVTP